MKNLPSCRCFETGPVEFHTDRQDTECDAWHRLLGLIEEAAADGREEFAPLRGMAWEDRSKIVTLPPTISKLKSVKHLYLYESNLVRIPPEIGEMTNLEVFTPYRSYRLHWFPYEITRCQNLRDSTVSTRALYGNFKFRPPFPNLPHEKTSLVDAKMRLGLDSIKSCSVCNRPFEDLMLYQHWISLQVATDVLPLLMNVCSFDCLMACMFELPDPPDNHLSGPHQGGLDLEQPPPSG